jgi:hypothetical protein
VQALLRERSSVLWSGLKLSSACWLDFHCFHSSCYSGAGCLSFAVFLQAGAAADVGRAVQGRVAEPHEDVERGGLQGLHAGEWDQLFEDCALQVCWAFGRLFLASRLD